MKLYICKFSLRVFLFFQSVFNKLKRYHQQLLKEIECTLNLSKVK